MQVFEETAIFGYYSIKVITDVFDNVMFSNRGRRVYINLLNSTYNQEINYQLKKIQISYNNLI